MNEILDSKKLMKYDSLKLTSPCADMIGDEVSTTGKLMIEAVAAFNSASYDGELSDSMFLFIPVSIDSFLDASCRFN